jgi:hypothetical protein
MSADNLHAYYIPEGVEIELDPEIHRSAEMALEEISREIDETPEDDLDLGEVLKKIITAACFRAFEAGVEFSSDNADAVTLTSWVGNEDILKLVKATLDGGSVNIKLELMGKNL